MSKWPLQLAVYGAGDAGAGGAFPALQPFLWRQLAELSNIVTSPRVSATAQLDNFTGPSLRWVLDPLRRQRAAQLPETNTGDPRELVAFCDWSNEVCPSERHVLVLSGHGLAFQDTVTQGYYDRSRGASPPGRRPASVFASQPLVRAGASARALMMDQSDFLTVPELRGALMDAADIFPSRRFDAVVFDACLMSNVELLYELRGSAAAVVGAVDEISGQGLNLAGAAHILDAAPAETLSPERIALSFVEAYAPQTTSDTCVAIRLDQAALEAGVVAFARFVELLRRDAERDEGVARLCRDALALSSRALIRYRSQSLADLNAVARAMRDTGLASDTLTALNASVRAFAMLVIDGRLGADYAGALGLSVFAPSSAEQLRLNSVDYRDLEFARRTGWLEALAGLFAAQLPADAPYANGSTFKPLTMIS